ncbi:MAG: amidohydrolase family protein, partial [Gemmataceae bacterium]
ASLTIPLGASTSLSSSAAEPASERIIIDTHQHLWIRNKLRLPWIAKGSKLDRDFTPDDYALAIKGTGITQAVYLEVDVVPEDHNTEADWITDLCASGKTATRAAVIGGRPESEGFGKYITRFKDHQFIRGLRRVLHGATKPGHCLSKPFLRGIQQLGENGLHFELCMRHAELPDAIKLARACPDTGLVLDHCGNPDLKKHEQWKRDLESLAKCKNLLACKISGIVASADPSKWSAEDLAPVVRHTLDTFGPDRVMFGSDWPVCLRTASIQQWLAALDAIVKDRKPLEQTKLFRTNAQRIYRLT